MLETCTRGQEGKSVTGITIPIEMRKGGGDTYQGEERRHQKWDSWNDKIQGINDAIQRIVKKILCDTSVQTCFSQQQDAHIQVYCPPTNGTDVNGINDPNEIRKKIIEVALKRAMQKMEKRSYLSQLQTLFSGLN